MTMIVLWCIAFLCISPGICTKEKVDNISFIVEGSEVGKPVEALVTILDNVLGHNGSLTISDPENVSRCTCKPPLSRGDPLSCNTEKKEDQCSAVKADYNISIRMNISEARKHHNGRWTVETKSTVKHVKKYADFHPFLWPENITVVNVTVKQGKQYYRMETSCMFPKPDRALYYQKKPFCNGLVNVTVNRSDVCNFDSIQWALECFSEYDCNSIVPEDLILSVSAPKETSGEKNISVQFNHSICPAAKIEKEEDDIIVVIVVLAVAVAIVIAVLFICYKKGCMKRPSMEWNKDGNGDGKGGGESINLDKSTTPLMTEQSNTAGSSQGNGQTSNGIHMMNGSSQCKTVSSDSAVDSLKCSFTRISEGYRNTEFGRTGVVNIPPQVLEQMLKACVFCLILALHHTKTIGKKQFEGIGIADVQCEVPQEETATFKVGKAELEGIGISDVQSEVPKEETVNDKGMETPVESTATVNYLSPVLQESTVIAEVTNTPIESTDAVTSPSPAPQEMTVIAKGIKTLVENTGAVNSGSPIPQELTVIAKGKSQLGEAGISDVQSGVPKEEKSNFKGINTPIESTDAVTSSSPAPPEVTVIAKGLQQNASHSTDLCKSGRQIGNYTTELSEGFGVKHLGHTIRTECDAGDLSVKRILTSYCNEEDMVDNGNMGILLHEQWTEVSSEEQNKPICLSKAIVVTKDEPEVLHPECDTSDENVNSSPKKLNFFNNVLERYPTDSVQRELQRLNGTTNTGSSRFRRALKVWWTNEDGKALKWTTEEKIHMHCSTVLSFNLDKALKVWWTNEDGKALKWTTEEKIHMHCSTVLSFNLDKALQVWWTNEDGKALKWTTEEKIHLEILRHWQSNTENHRLITLQYYGHVICYGF